MIVIEIREHENDFFIVFVTRHTDGVSSKELIHWLNPNVSRPAGVLNKHSSTIILDKILKPRFQIFSLNE